jgi:L-asparaginase / beta-aspartyl-peptidase
MRAMAIPAIIVHGGAGAIEDERRAACVAGVERAAQAGWQVLAGGGSAIDAVCAAVRVLEDDAEFNAGYGSVLTQLGIVETDAAVMDGDLRLGAVGAVPWMRHPVELARHLMERNEHTFLVAGGALLYAKEHGFAPSPPDTMISPRARARFEAAKAKREEQKTGDTVGACAVDAQGRVVAATSTGGILFKRPGRVGDSPLPGAGLHADRRAGAASSTGHGESIMRVLMCKVASDALRGGASPDQAARAAVEELVSQTSGEGGVIVIGLDGRIGHHTSTARMPWAAVENGVASSGAEPT